MEGSVNAGMVMQFLGIECICGDGAAAVVTNNLGAGNSLIPIETSTDLLFSPALPHTQQAHRRRVGPRLKPTN